MYKLNKIRDTNFIKSIRNYLEYLQNTHLSIQCMFQSGRIIILKITIK